MARSLWVRSYCVVLPVSRFRFFLRAVADARCDPFFPAPWYVAPFWVLRHWGWLRSPQGPYWEDFNA